MALNRWSLSRLVAWTGTVGLAVLFLPVGLYFAWSVTAAGERSAAARGEVLARTMAAQVVTPMLLQDQVSLQSVLRKALRADASVRYFCIANARGEMVAHTFGRAYPGGLIPLWSEPVGGVVRYRSDGEPLMDVSTPVLSGQLGILHLGMSRREAVTAGWRMLWVMAGALAAAMAVVILGAHVVAVQVSAPLRRLEGHVSRLPEAVGGANPGHAPAGEAALGISGTREVASLARRFSEMGRRLTELEQERRATQAQMIHAERLAALGELAAGLAHEIHNPLDGMLECVRYLEADPDKGPRGEKFYPLLRDGLERIAQVMNEMLMLARSGRRVNLEPCPVADVMASLLLLMESRLKDRRVRVTRKEPPGCVCLCDRQGLVQAALNLLLNAVEAAEKSPDPEVRIEATCDARWVYLAVEDSGAGVPDAYHDRVFEPFFTTRPPGKGTGLGLAVSRDLVRAAGGDITLASAPGRLGGARFVLRLPKVTAKESRRERVAGEDSHR